MTVRSPRLPNESLEAAGAAEAFPSWPVQLKISPAGVASRRPGCVQNRFRRICERAGSAADCGERGRGCLPTVGTSAYGLRGRHLRPLEDPPASDMGDWTAFYAAPDVQVFQAGYGAPRWPGRGCKATDGLLQRFGHILKQTELPAGSPKSNARWGARPSGPGHWLMGSAPALPPCHPDIRLHRYAVSTFTRSVCGFAMQRRGRRRADAQVGSAGQQLST